MKIDAAFIRTLSERLQFGCPNRPSTTSVFGEPDIAEYERIGLEAADVLNQVAASLEDQQTNATMTNDELRGMANILWSRAERAVREQHGIAINVPVYHSELTRLEFLKQALEMNRIK